MRRLSRRRGLILGGLVIGLTAAGLWALLNPQTTIPPTLTGPRAPRRAALPASESVAHNPVTLEAIPARAPAPLPAALAPISTEVEAAPPEALAEAPPGPARILGRITDSYGQPLAGIAISLTRLIREERRWRTEEAGEVQSDAEGAFTFEVEPGQYRCEAAAAGFAPSRKGLRLEPGEEERVELELGLGALLEVRVEDPRGQPVVGAEVRLRGRDDREGETDDRGIASFEDLPEGLVQLRVSARGFVDYRGSRRAVAEGEVDDTIIILKDAGILVGQVLGHNGEPAAGARLEVYRGEERLHRGPVEEDGSFEVDDLSPGEVTVYARLGGKGAPKLRARAQARVEPELPAEVLLRLREGGVIVGQLVDASGAPLAKKRIELSHDDGPSDGRSRTDEQGAFRFEDLLPGRYTVKAWWANPQRSTSIAASVTVSSGGQATASLTFPQTYTLSGVVVDEQGQTIPNILVYSNEGAASFGVARTNEQGRFKVTGLFAGSYDIFVRHHRRGLLGRAQVAVGSGAEVRLVAQEQGRLQGRLVDHIGQPLARIELRLDGIAAMGSVHRRARTDDNGRFEFDSLYDGEYRLRASGRTLLSAANRLGVEGLAMPERRVAVPRDAARDLHLAAQLAAPKD